MKTTLLTYTVEVIESDGVTEIQIYGPHGLIASGLFEDTGGIADFIGRSIERNAGAVIETAQRRH